MLEAVARLRAAKDAPFLACDIIAGFPGETDADFAETLARLRECNFAWIHAFPFSPRPGTPAAALKQVPSAVKAERARAAESGGRRQMRLYRRLRGAGDERDYRAPREPRAGGAALAELAFGSRTHINGTSALMF